MNVGIDVCVFDGWMDGRAACKRVGPIYVRTCVCMYVYIYAYMYACKYASMYLTRTICNKEHNNHVSVAI